MTDWLNEIKDRAEAATPGIWCTEYDGVATYTITADVRLHLNRGFSYGPSICTLANADDGSEAYANAAFIARARADIPRLLDRITQLTSELDQAKAENRDLIRALGLNEEAAA